MQRSRSIATFLGMLCFLAPVRLVLADEGFALKGGERIVFFGDSITQGGGYVTQVELYLMTRFPGQRFEVINHGISSETISGTSEPDHHPRRPDAQDRFDRDIKAWKPDVVVACFGMNDGNYYPFDQGRFDAYRAGVQKLIDRVREGTKARLVLLTPPPFDPYRRQVGDPNAIYFGYKFPAVDYDGTLQEYAKWLLTLRNDERIVADVHQDLNDHLSVRRRERVSFYLASDAVHPGATGHLLMAQTLLRAWNAPSLVSEAIIDAKDLATTSDGVKSIELDGEGFSFLWTTRIPMPVDDDCDPESLKVARISETLNRHRLQIDGLESGTYHLHAAEAGHPEVEIGTFSDAQLATGLDLNTLKSFPTNRRAHVIFESLTAHRDQEYDEWRARIAASVAPSTDATPRDDVRVLCGAMTIRIRITPRR